MAIQWVVLSKVWGGEKHWGGTLLYYSGILETLGILSLSLQLREMTVFLLLEVFYWMAIAEESTQPYIFSQPHS